MKRDHRSSGPWRFSPRREKEVWEAEERKALLEAEKAAAIATAQEELEHAAQHPEGDAP